MVYSDDRTGERQNCNYRCGIAARIGRLCRLSPSLARSVDYVDRQVRPLWRVTLFAIPKYRSSYSLREKAALPTEKSPWMTLVLARAFPIRALFAGRLSSARGCDRAGGESYREVSRQISRRSRLGESAAREWKMFSRDISHPAPAGVSLTRACLRSRFPSRTFVRGSALVPCCPRGYL